MSETDSFIDEVTEEVRRDKLFQLYRRYGWIAGLVVVAVVAGASWVEYRKYADTQAAQAMGDAVLTALQPSEATARADNLAALEPGRPEAGVFLDMLEAAARAEASDREAALLLLDKIADAPDAPETYRQLAILKGVMLRGADQDRAERLAVLDGLMTPGNPFRVLAMEQKALALYEFGNSVEAIALLQAILDEPGATQGLLQRVQQLIVALGGELPASNGAVTDQG